MQKKHEIQYYPKHILLPLIRFGEKIDFTLMVETYVLTFHVDSHLSLI